MGAIPAAESGVFSACYDSGGNVKLIDNAKTATCPKGHTGPVTWNQIGPKGDKGDQGIQGIQGLPGTDGTNGTNGANGTNGTNGTSDVHQASSSSTDGGPLSVSVPAGSYLVQGYATVSNTDGDGQYAVCLIQGTEVTRQSLPGDSGQDTLPIMGTVTLASAGTISLDCGGYNIFVWSRRMFVTRVTSIING
jgi:hypothetical protein